MIYIIATTPRTGGHLLCELLSSTAVCGRPAEYVLRQAPNIWRNIAGCRNREEYLAYYLRAGWTQNGTFGTKLTWWQFCEFTAELGKNPKLNDLERACLIKEAFGRCEYVFLRRHDQIRQAISYFRALQTGAWNSRSAVETKSCIEESFKIEAINQLLAIIRYSESLWFSYLNQLGITYLTMFYEDLIREPRKSVTSILSFLGVDHEWGGICRSTLLRQSDSLTDAWVSRYWSLRAQGGDSAPCPFRYPG